MTPSAHAFLAPSSAARWVRCPLSASLEAAYPEAEQSPAALEGTAAHWVVQMLLQGTPVDLGTQAPNGVAVTGDMLEGARLVIYDIAEALGVDWARSLVIERPVAIPRVHPSQNWGTPDYRAWGTLPNNGRRILRVWDYKFGHGIVEAPGNWQMIDYAAGLLDEAAVNGLDDQETVLEFVVIQPRAYHRDGPVRRWRCVASDLRSYINILANAAAKATGPNPEACPHPDAEGCNNCTGRWACEALQRGAYHGADVAQQYGALELSPHAMGLELRTLKRLHGLMGARISGLEEQVAATIKRGGLVPFWLFKSSPGRLAWTKPVPEVLMLGDMLGVDLKKDVDAITPTQAKALAKAKGLPETLFDAYASRPAGAATLREDDGTKAALIFGGT